MRDKLHTNALISPAVGRGKLQEGEVETIDDDTEQLYVLQSASTFEGPRHVPKNASTGFQKMKPTVEER
jgi:hypothetical protein